MRLAEGAAPMGRSGTAVKDPMVRLTLAFSGPAAPRHYGTAHTTIDEHDCEPGSSRVRCNALLAGVSQFFANEASNSVLEGFGLVLHVVPESGVDECLVVATTGVVDLLLEPRHDVVVQADSDADLTGWMRNHRSTLAATEVVFAPH